MSRACLAGPALIDHKELIEELRIHNQVVCVADPMSLARTPALVNADILVLDAGGIRGQLTALIAGIRLDRPELPIVLVNGGLTEDEKAEAFALGVEDYFAAPCDVRLLIERLEVLVRVRGAPEGRTRRNA